MGSGTITKYVKENNLKLKLAPIINPPSLIDIIFSLPVEANGPCPQRNIITYLENKRGARVYKRLHGNKDEKIHKSEALKSKGRTKI